MNDRPATPAGGADGRDAGGCLLVALVVLVIWAVAKAVGWLDQGFHMALAGTVVALLLLAWLWSLPAARTVVPDPVSTGAVVAGAAAAKPLGLFWGLAGLYAALAGSTFFLGLGYGLLGLLLGGFGISLIGWSWWRPFRLRIGPRLHLPWWVHLATSAGVATVATVALIGYVAAATAHEADRRARTLDAQLTRADDSLRRYDYDRASDWTRRAKAVDPESDAVRRREAALERGRSDERDYRLAKRRRAEGRYAAAVRILRRLGDYRQSEGLSRRYRQEGVRALLRRARRAVSERPARAQADLRAAVRLDPEVARTTTYRRLHRRAKEVAAARRARARKREERYLDIPTDEELGLEDDAGDYGGEGGSFGDDSRGRDRFDVPFVPFD